MRFRTQLVTGIGALVLVTVFCGVMAVISLQLTTRSAERVTARVIDDLDALHDVRLDAEQLVSTGRGYLLTGDEADREQLTKLQKNLDDSLQALRERNRVEFASKVIQVEIAAKEYERVVADAVARRTPTTSIDGVGQILEEDVAPRRQKLQSAVDDLTDLEEDDLTRLSHRAGTVVRAVGITTLGAVIFGIAIGVVLAVIITRRLSGSYRAEQETARLAQEAAWSRKELLDVVSHDLRSPLSSILLGLELIRQEQPEARHVSVISHSAERMQRLVNDLLDASRAEIAQLELDLKPWRPAEIIDAAGEQFEELARAAGLQLCEISNCDGEVLCDRQRVLQVLANLLGNAIKFSRKGDEIVLAANPAGDGVRFSVTDRGPGIPDDEKQHMFEAYRQGAHTSHRGGIGLGLYICKKLVEAHGGTIGIDSKHGEGSTFWFVIPRRVPGRA
ncbi:MAG TPA: ATP-binding protein [Kofleriaceae bacterium]|nr:ATP-binding protein [Kofleriaceae bacterium]